VSVVTDKKIEQLIEDKIAYQYISCRKNYYKTMLRMIIGFVSSTFLILAGVIAWSYNPISDIAVLKSEVKTMNKKLDVLIKDEKENNKKSNLTKDKRNIKNESVDFDLLCIESPALGAIGKNVKN